MGKKPNGVSLRALAYDKGTQTKLAKRLNANNDKFVKSFPYKFRQRNPSLPITRETSAPFQQL